MRSERNRFRKIAAVLLALVLATASASLLSGCSEEGPVDTATLYVYNWGEYISDGSEDSLDANAAFEEWYLEEFNVKVTVNYSTFSSNESLYAKLSSGSVKYDVIVPSDYMIERMIEEDLLAPLDYSNIPNAENLLPEFWGENSEHSEYDPGNVYSVPYLYGMIGIIYNTEMVDEDEEDIGSWNLMWNEKYAGNILQFNNSRDAFGTAQYLLGIDVNTEDETLWRQVLEKMKEQKKILQGYVMDEIYNKMENGSAAIASYYAGDFLTMYENNEDLEFFYPEEGTNIYVDAMCIPKNCNNKLIAERYIDFMLSEEPAVANAEYTYYASPNRLVLENEEYQEYMNDIKDDAFDLVYDTEGIQTSTYRNLSAKNIVLVNDLWEELKAEVEISTSIYVMCAVIIAVLIVFLIYFKVRKHRRNIY